MGLFSTTPCFSGRHDPTERIAHAKQPLRRNPSRSGSGDGVHSTQKYDGQCRGRRLGALHWVVEALLARGGVESPVYGSVSINHH
jgi:hypothetical protein